MKTFSAEQSTRAVATHQKRSGPGATPAFKLRESAAAFLLESTDGDDLSVRIEESSDGETWTLAAPFPSPDVEGRAMVGLIHAEPSMAYRVAWDTGDEPALFSVKVAAIR